MSEAFTVASMTRLDYRKDAIGRFYWYDTEENKKISEAAALEALNSQPENRQQDPVAAIWHKNGTDYPVVIEGIIGRHDDEDYLLAQGSQTGIPRSELTFLSSEPITDNTEYTKKLELTNQKLEQKNETLLARVAELELENSELHSQIDSLTTQLAALRSDFEAFKQQYEAPSALDARLKEAFGEEWVPRKAMQVVVTSEDEKEGWLAVSDPYTNVDGDWYIKVSKEDKIIDVPIEDVELTDNFSEKTSPADISWRERLGHWVSLRRPVTYIQTRIPVGGGEVIEEEITEERTNPIVIAAGMLGAAAIGAFIGWELKNTGHSNVKEFHTIINQNNHLKTEVHNMHQTLNQDTKVINENHRILKYNRAALKDLHEQLSTISKQESGEVVHGGGVGGNYARLNYYGDTVWHETANRLREKLGSSATISQIRKATNYVLHINGLRWNGGGYGVDAHKLPLGFRFKIPKNIVEIISK